MVKKGKQEEVSEDFSFGNISKASSQFSNTSKKEKGKAVMNIRVTKQAYYDFGKLHSMFISETGLFDSMRDSKDFWRTSLLEMKRHLEENNNFAIASESFSNMVKKPGRRPAGTRYSSSDQLLGTTFGNYDDDTLEIYDNIMYSLALQEDMEHVKEYSRSYFFYDVLNFLEKHINTMIKKYKN